MMVGVLSAEESRPSVSAHTSSSDRLVSNVCNYPCSCHSATVDSLFPVEMGRTVAVTLLICCGFSLCQAQHGHPDEEKPFPPCPEGSRPLLRQNGEPRKCLPHQNHLCLSGVTNSTNAKTVCCWNNHIDYFCCLDVTAAQCPTYRNVTVVIHNSSPHDPNAPREYHFREGIENELSPALVNGVGGASSIRQEANNVQEQDGHQVRPGGKR